MRDAEVFAQQKKFTISIATEDNANDGAELNTMDLLAFVVDGHKT
jgi:hypothetical protein